MKFLFDKALFLEGEISQIALTTPYNPWRPPLSPDRRFQTAQLPLDGFPKVLDQVKAISDLACLWRALTRSVSVKASTIPADDLDFRMPL